MKAIPECIGMEILFSFQIFTRNEKIRSGVLSSRHKGIVKKYLCKNFFQDNRMPAFCGNLNIEGDE